MRRALATAVLLAATAAEGRPLEAGESECGGNAYSSAQVTEGRPVRRGPLTAMPDTLCADIAGPRPNVDVQIYGVPGLDGSGRGALGRNDLGRNDLGEDDRGTWGTTAPYDGRARRGAGPSGH